MGLGERLATLRKERGLSKRELSFALNLEQSTYGKYELGKRQPSLEVLQKLSSFFDVSTDYLLGKISESANPRNEVKKTGFMIYLDDYDGYELTPEDAEDIRKYAQWRQYQRYLERMEQMNNYSQQKDDDVQTIRVAARNGKDEVKLTKAQREAIIKARKEAEPDDVSDLI
ncbi:MAG: helix-turn-helix domain-containing protein [Defluviitaleaceae bacterium]|nr:helix-turn-helix domain-containing protein [Defluviitaleaceae bacterium]